MSSWSRHRLAHAGGQIGGGGVHTTLISSIEFSEG